MAEETLVAGITDEIGGALTPETRVAELMSPDPLPDPSMSLATIVDGMDTGRDSELGDSSIEVSDVENTAGMVLNTRVAV